MLPKNRTSVNVKKAHPFLRSIAIWLYFATLAAVFAWIYRDEVRAFLAFARDREALTAYLDRVGIIGPLVFGGLIAIQVMIPALPAEPPMIAGAYAYGFLTGFLVSWLVMVAITPFSKSSTPAVVRSSSW